MDKNNKISTQYIPVNNVSFVVVFWLFPSDNKILSHLNYDIQGYEDSEENYIHVHVYA